MGAGAEFTGGDAPTRERVLGALRTVHDPEIPVNIYDLGLIYRVEIAPDGAAHVVMTLTAPNCPVADKIPEEVRRAVEGVEGVGPVTVDLVFEPAWSPDMMTEVAEIELDAMGVNPRRAKEAFTSGSTGLTIGRRPAKRG